MPRLIQRLNHLYAFQGMDFKKLLMILIQPTNINNIILSRSKIDDGYNNGVYFLKINLFEKEVFFEFVFSVNVLNVKLSINLHIIRHD